jgi:AcrR family transcriptional regulator
MARKSAETRREEIVAIAFRHFAEGGYNGTSTEAIAREAGISQPYLFRLFGTKKELYLATSERKLEEVYQVFERASRGKTGEEALQAMGEAYGELIADRERLQLMMQCMAAAGADPEIREGVRRVWRDLVELVERVAPGDPERTAAFFAKGMLLNVLNAMGVFEDPTPWGDRLIEGCRSD